MLCKRNYSLCLTPFFIQRSSGSSDSNICISDSKTNSLFSLITSVILPLFSFFLLLFSFVILASILNVFATFLFDCSLLFADDKNHFKDSNNYKYHLNSIRNSELKITSQHMTFDPESKIYSASDDVHAMLDQYELSCKKFIYNIPEQKFAAQGDASFKFGSNDDLYLANKFVFQSKDKYLNIDQLNALFRRNTFFFHADSVIHKSSNSYDAHNVLITFCDFCTDFDSIHLPKKIIDAKMMNRVKEKNRGNADPTQRSLPRDKPLWYAKAKKATIDLDDGSILYDDFSLYFLDKKMLDMPRFSAPLPTIRNKSGILPVSIYSMNKDVGAMFSIPMYWYINKDLDLTFTVNIAARESPLFNLETRGLIGPSGGYRIDLVFANSKYKTDTDISKNRNITYLELAAQYPIQQNIDLGINSRYVFNESKVFLKKYAISEDDVVLSDFFMQLYSPLNWGYVDLHIADIAQDMRPDHIYGTIIGLPNIKSTFKIPTSFKNSLVRSVSLITDIELLQLYSGDDFGDSKLPKSFNHLSSRLTNIFGFKAEINLGSRIQAWIQPLIDIECVKNNVANRLTARNKNDFKNKIRIDEAIKAQYADYKNDSQFSDENSSNNDLNLSLNNKFAYNQITPQIVFGLAAHDLIRTSNLSIEPLLHFTVSPSRAQQIPYFERQFMELDYGNIFSSSIRNAVNQLQIGSHIEYGLRGSLYFSEFVTTFALGNSIQLYSNDLIKDLKEPGISIYTNQKRQSAYFLQCSVEKGNSTLKWQQWLSPDGFNTIHSEIDWTMIYDGIILNFDYTFFNRKYYYNDQHNYDIEIGGQIWWNIYKSLWIAPSGRMNIGPKKGAEWRNRPIDIGGTVRYQDNCFTLDVSIVYNYLRLQNLPPSLMYMIELKFPNLGIS